jgi:hypothetical protein
MPPSKFPLASKRHQCRVCLAANNPQRVFEKSLLGKSNGGGLGELGPLNHSH